MYLKLAIRNAKRSVMDYLLYITSMIILLTIMQISNCIAVMGKMQAGLHTTSLPVLITIILVVLVEYMNRFMLKQRAKEFSNYLLLGMEKRKLSKMFLMEFLTIGMVCFSISALLGFVVDTIFSSAVFPQKIKWDVGLWGKSLWQTFCYFCVVESVSGFRVKHRVDCLQIRELMYEKQRNQIIKNKNNYKCWSIVFAISFICFVGLLYGITYGTGVSVSLMISVIAVPVLCLIFAFYQGIYGYFYAKRQVQPESLYKGNRLYMLAQMTSDPQTNAWMNGIFCVCLCFAAAAFLMGTIMLQADIKFFHAEGQQWMGFLQISICIIFLVIYFSILALQQVIQIREEIKSLQTLYHIGKSGSQIRALVKKQLAIRLLMPLGMCFLILLAGLPLINWRLNRIFAASMQNIMVKSIGWFLVCFLVCYVLYFQVIYAVSRRYIEGKDAKNISW